MNRNVEFGGSNAFVGSYVSLQCTSDIDVPGWRVIWKKIRLQSELSNLSAGTFLTSLWQRCMRTSMPPRLQFQLNVRTIHPDFVGAYPLQRRRAEHLAGADLEFGAMPGASDLVPLELPL
jgi:hypothetical protein